VNAIPRKSVTVAKVTSELNRAVEIRRALAEHADDPQLLLDTIEGETDLAEACMVVYGETLEDEILLEGLTATIKSLQDRKARVEKSIDTRRGIILMAMDKAGLQTIKAPIATLSIRETQPRLNVSEEALIPSRFWKPADPTLDRKALAEALKAKEAVPGASLSNGGISLSIRVK
jgi:hypothetical protein